MRLCILIATYGDPSSELRDLDPDPDPSPHLSGHEIDVVVVLKATAAAQIDELVRRGYDAFVNLCDGAPDEDRAGIEVAWALERHGVAFTGAYPDFYGHTRAEMKAACARAGIRTPRFAFVETAAEALAAAEALRFPLIVKPRDGYASIGITRASRVVTPSELAERVEATARAHGGALVEEFIEGRELTVLVAEPGEGEDEPRAYPPVEFLFPPGETFKHFHLKWVACGDLAAVPVEDAALAGRLMEMSRRLFSEIGASSYGRCDIRMDGEGALYMLEINANCALFYPEGNACSADLILAEAPGGHRAFLEHILACAERRLLRAAGALLTPPPPPASAPRSGSPASPASGLPAGTSA